MRTPSHSRYASIGSRRSSANFSTSGVAPMPATSRIQQAEQALRLSPFDPMSNIRHMAIAIAHFVACRFEEAAAAANRAAQAHPRFSPPYWMRAAALVKLDRVDEAKTMALRMLEVQPEFTIRSITMAPFANREILDALGDALHRVGLPD
jgi:adenylate cyclase